MKSYIRAFALVVLLCAVSACTGNLKPTNAQNAVFEATSLEYQTALDIAIAYDSLPDCAVPSHPPLCSSTSTVVAIKAAKDKASPAIKAAQAAVRDPNFGASNIQTAIVLAQQAVALLTAITSQLKVN
jgi:hypothetical protein